MRALAGFSLSCVFVLPLACCTSARVVGAYTSVGSTWLPVISFDRVWSYGFGLVHALRVVQVTLVIGRDDFVARASMVWFLWASGVCMGFRPRFIMGTGLNF